MDAADWKLKDARNRQRFALRRAVKEMAAGERQLARTFDALDRHLDLVKHDLDVELRSEHFGRDPERLPAWRSARNAAEAAPPSVGIPDVPSRDGRVGTRLAIHDEVAPVAVT